MKLQKGYTPLYHQLEIILRKRILSGKISPLEPFPTDYDLCREFEVSRITVRQALKNLEDDGLVKREQGRGTFVTASRRAKFFYEMSSSLEESFGVREAYEIELTSKERLKADHQIAGDLGVEEGEDIYLIKGVQALFKDKRHFQALEIQVPKEIGKKMALGKLEYPRLSPILEKASQEVAVQCHQVISATTASREMASRVKVKAGHPLLVTKNIFLSKRKKVLGIVTRYTPGDMFQLVYRMKIKRSKVYQFGPEDQLGE